MALEDFGSDVKKASTPSAASIARARNALFGGGDDDDDDGELFKVSKSQWAICGSGEFTGIQRTQKTLTPGVYKVKLRNGEVIMCKS